MEFYRVIIIHTSIFLFLIFFLLKLGHDPVQSLMYGLFGSTTDQYRLDGNPDYANQREWSFLFGGSGDGELSNFR